MRSQRQQYVAEWATKAHRSPSDVYVPESLQPDRCGACGWVRQGSAPGPWNGPGNHTGCKEGRW